MTLIDGKKVAEKCKKNIEERIKRLDRTPGFAVIRIGEDEASKIYVRLKHKMSEELGINFTEYHLDENITQEELISLIKKLNADDEVDGILLQSPIPYHLNILEAFQTIAPEKDADGFSPLNLGRLWEGQSDIIPATVRSILTLIDYYGIEMAGKNTVIIGRSVIVGKPLAAVLVERDATVTIAHSKTKNLSELTKNADVIISDVGKAHLVTEDMVKEGAVIIDVGMNRENGKLMGDVDFDKVAAKVNAITPVPGGVGPLTVASLMKQAVILTRKQHGR